MAFPLSKYIDFRCFKIWPQVVYKYLKMFRNNQKYAKNIQMGPKLLKISFQYFCRHIWQNCRQSLSLPAINLSMSRYGHNFYLENILQSFMLSLVSERLENLPQIFCWYHLQVENFRLESLSLSYEYLAAGS